jgi:hypothetical protein
MHGASQKASKPGETMAQDSFTKTNRFPFPTWTARWLSYFLESVFLILIAFLLSLCFLFYLSLFLTYRTMEQGWGRPTGGSATGVRTRWRMDEQRR